MAITEYKNILLKDGNGKALLPITLSYYVEYKNGVSVKSYLDTLGDAVEYSKSSIDVINDNIDDINEKIGAQGSVTQNIIDTVNTILTSYVQRPDVAAEVVFNTSYETLSEDIRNLDPDATVNEQNFVSTQKVIENIDSRVKNVDERLTRAESYIDGLNTNFDSLNSRVNAAEATIVQHTTYITDLQNDVNNLNKVNDLFDENGDLDLWAYSVKFVGSSSTYTEGATDVNGALNSIGQQLSRVSQIAIDAAEGAGVTSVTGYNGILVNGRNETAETTAVRVSLNLDNDKLILDPSTHKVTVDDSKLTIDGSQIAGYITSDHIDGGLTADNITVTYTDNSGDEPVEAEKSVQEFYNETNSYITTINNDIDELKSSYVVTLTPDDNSSYAKVYTLNQGGIEIGKINIPKDQFLKDVKYESYNDSYALIFEWMYGDDDELTGAPFTYIPISNFIDAITGEIASDVTDLQTSVSEISDKVDAIENSYVTSATINGRTVEPQDHVLHLSYVALYDEGNSTEVISSGFLEAIGINE